MSLIGVSAVDPTPPWWERGRLFRRSSAGYFSADDRMLACADARLGYGWSQLNGPSVQAYGSAVAFASAADVTGTLVDGSTSRFALVADPDDAAKVCWRFRLHPDDPDTSASKRVEFSFAGTPALSPGPMFYSRNDVVIGLCLRLQDWTALSDDQLVFQLHGPTGAPIGNPWLSLLVTNGVMRLSLRYDTNASPDTETMTILDLWTDENWSPTAWHRLVVMARQGYAGNGAVRCLWDGEMVADYSGPVGYNDDALGASYVKNGYYHWVDSGNDWDTDIMTREVWNKGAYIANGLVSANEMDDFLATL